MKALPLPREAIVLAGGFGTRLRPIISDVPKPLAPIAGRPFLLWLLDGLARQNISRVILATGYMGDLIRDRLGDAYGSMSLVHVREETPLGTGGALFAALSQAISDRVYVLNGDTWLGVALAPLAAEAPEADLVLAVRPVADRARYGSVVVDANRVLGVEEKGPSGPGLVNAGLYLVRRDLPLRYPMPSAFSLEAEILSKPGNLNIRAFRTEAPFLDIGTPEDFAMAQTLIPEWAAS